MPDRDLLRLFDQPLSEQAQMDYELELWALAHGAYMRACGYRSEEVWYDQPAPRHNV